MEDTELTQSAQHGRGLGPVDALAVDVEEEALVADKVSAGTSLCAVFPRVLYNLSLTINLGNKVCTLKFCNPLSDRKPVVANFTSSYHVLNVATNLTVQPIFTVRENRSLCCSILSVT